MRTTVNIDEHLLARAKDRAAEQRTTLGSILEEALQRLLADRPGPVERPPIPIFTGGTGANPAIDWSSNVSIREFMDRDLPPDKLR